MSWSARLGVDDRQTAGVGYDLFARRPSTTEQRLVEVKGFTGALDRSCWSSTNGRKPSSVPRVLALRRVDCGTAPRRRPRSQDPAGTLAGPTHRALRIPGPNFVG